jgi:hypothetical protein
VDRRASGGSRPGYSASQRPESLSVLETVYCVFRVPGVGGYLGQQPIPVII